MALKSSAMLPTSTNGDGGPEDPLELSGTGGQPPLQS